VQAFGDARCVIGVQTFGDARCVSVWHNVKLLVVSLKLTFSEYKTYRIMRIYGLRLQKTDGNSKQAHWEKLY
jgi:hypothetical protein